MFGPLGQLQHDPGIVERDIGLPAGNTGFFEQFGCANGRKKKDDNLDKNKNQQLMR
jgi:hypothetical protein